MRDLSQNITSEDTVRQILRIALGPTRSENADAHSLLNVKGSMSAKAENLAARLAQVALADLLLQLFRGNRSVLAQAEFQIESILTEVLVSNTLEVQESDKENVTSPMSCSGPELCFRLIGTMTTKWRHRISCKVDNPNHSNREFRPEVCPQRFESDSAENTMFKISVRLLETLIHLRPAPPARAWGAACECLLMFLQPKHEMNSKEKLINCRVHQISGLILVELLHQHLLHVANRQSQNSIALCQVLESKFKEAQQLGRDASSSFLDQIGGPQVIARLFRASVVHGPLLRSGADCSAHETNAESFTSGCSNCASSAPTCYILFSLYLHSLCIEDGSRSQDSKSFLGLKGHLDMKTDWIIHDKASCSESSLESNTAKILGFNDVVTKYFQKDLCTISSLFHQAITVHSKSWDAWVVKHFGVSFSLTANTGKIASDYEAVQSIFQHMPCHTISEVRIIHRFLKKCHSVIKQIVMPRKCRLGSSHISSTDLTISNIWDMIEAEAAKATFDFDSDRRDLISALDRVCSLLKMVENRLKFEKLSKESGKSSRIDGVNRQQDQNEIRVLVEGHYTSEHTDQVWCEVVERTASYCRFAADSTAPELGTLVCLHARAIACAAQACTLDNYVTVGYVNTKQEQSKSTPNPLSRMSDHVKRGLCDAIKVMLETYCRDLLSTVPHVMQEHVLESVGVFIGHCQHDTVGGLSEADVSLRSSAIELAEVLLSATSLSSASFLNIRVQIAKWRAVSRNLLAEKIQSKTDFDKFLASDNNIQVARHGARTSLKYMRESDRALYLNKLAEVLQRAQNAEDPVMVADALMLWKEMR